MITDCPDSKEVSHFYFLQLRTLKLVEENESISPKPLNIIAAASKYGLLFVGVKEGLKVLKLEDILDIDGDKENKNIVENFSFIFIRSYTPVLLALNASEKVLALCAESSLGVSIRFYDVLNFANEGVNWQPFATSFLKSTTGFCDFIWNPTNEALYVCCLKDGSLHMEELTETGTKSVASLLSANATTVCWSPKGKQLVAGRRDGFFVQYKPTLQEVKNVPPPPSEGNSFSVANICWISNTSFAVLYVTENGPHLFMVSTVKDSPVSYTNFYDVCLGNASIPEQKYFLHLEPQWGILICASIDSVEIAVLGEMPNWVQWDLKEDGKALLPIKDGATHAIGTAVIYSATRKIIISESESYSPMPIIFFMTNNGLLVSFYMINSNTDAASLVSPPVMLLCKNFENDSSTSEAERMVLKRSSSSSVYSSSSTFAVASAPSIISSTYISGYNQPLSSSTFNVECKTSVSDQHTMHQKFENQVVNTVPAFVTNEKSAPIHSESPKSILNVQETGKLSQTLNRPWEGTTVSPSNAKRETEANSLPHVSDMRNEMLYNPDSSYMIALCTEIQHFAKELQDLKQLQNSLVLMNNDKDMATLNAFALNLHNFQKDSSEMMQSLNNDIFALRNILLESFVMVEEVSSRLKCKNDHSYITMLKERALDPISAKRMQKIHQHYQYLNTQMQELNDKLDHDFVNLLYKISKKQKSLKNIPSISSTEAIYKTIVHNQKIIHNLRKTVNVLYQKSEETKIRGICRNSDWSGYRKRSTQEDLSKLADEFLQIKFTHQEEKEPVSTKKLSSEYQNSLKKYLTNTNVVTVRPTAVYSASQSRLLSNALSASHSTISNLEEKQCEFSQSTVPAVITDDIPQVCFVSETPRSKAPLKSLYAFENSKNESTINCLGTPVYEAITPPESFVTDPLDERSCNGNIIGSNVFKDKSSVLSEFALPKTTVSTSDVSTFKEKDAKLQSTSTSLFSSGTNSTKYSFCTPFSAEEQFPLPSSTVFSQVPSSLILSQTLPFKSDLTKSTENEPLKLFSTTSNTLFPFVLKNSKQNMLEQKIESDAIQKSLLVTASAVPAPIQETKRPIISEAPVFQQKDITILPKSNSPLNLSFGQNTLFSVTGTKATNFPLYTLPEGKKPLATTEVTSSATQLKSSTGFFLEKPVTTSASDSNISLSPQKISASFTTVGNEISYVNSSTPDKIIVDSKSSTIPKLSTTTDLKLGTLTTSSVDISLNQLTLVTSQKTDMAIVTSSENTITVSDISVSSPSITSESKILPQMPIISSVSISTAVLNSTNISSITTTATDYTTLCDISSACVISEAENSVLAVPAFITKSTTSTICSLPSQNVAVTTSVSISNSTETDTVTSTSEFGFKSQSLFNQTATGAVSYFGNSKPENGSVFGQAIVSQSGTFGQPQVSKPGHSATPGNFFSQNPTFEVSSTTSNSDPNNSASAFSFGKSTFGQQSSGSFGLAKSLFGQSATSFSQTASPSSFSFGQTATTNSFGQGAFFSGLGGKSSEENANKNVFSMSNSIKPVTDTNLFGSSTSTNFVEKSGSFSGGSFSSGRGSVAQSGFGSFQQNSPQKPVGFGSAPAFGGNPTFGCSPSFGSPPSFGSGNALLSMYAQQSQANFSNFASASTPTFGALASQTSTFGSPQAMGVGFGTQNTFGASPFAGSNFGAQTPGFGSTSSQSPSLSAFTQWRN